MPIRFYNTLSHKLDDFLPLDPPTVTMYNCGPTVYDFAHIGNFRAFLLADLIRRTLELNGYAVQQVMNITDVGHMTEDSLVDGGGQDKMAVAAQRLKEAKKSGKLPPGVLGNPEDPYEVADYYTQAFLEDAKALRLRIADEYPAHMPRATAHVPAMQDIIRTLIAKQHAYVGSDGCVYYDVQSFPAYGKLSGNTLEKIRSGAGGRVDDAHQAVKKHPADFLLWKPDPSHLMKWDSPWGAGYPGWHIECSAMALAVLSQLVGHPLQTIDIHTGGEDNIFPHHECEIAQSCGATGQSEFARYWLHTRFLLVEGRKMSKSAGNFFTVRDVLEGRASGRSVDPAVLRLAIMRVHYRANMDFTIKGLEEAAHAVQRLRQLATDLSHQVTASQRLGLDLPEVHDHATVRAFIENLSDDLNIAGALAEVFRWMNEPRDTPEVSWAVLRKLDAVLDVLGDAASAQGRATPADHDATIRQQCQALDLARAAKDFATADRIRKKLQAQGYDVQTTKTGTTARKKLA